jgi:ATP-dependent protease ClpP protease subunit
VKSNIILFLLGILLCSSSFADNTKNLPSIILTEKNHVLLSGPVNDKSVAEVQIQLGKIAVTNPIGSVVYLVLDTPGGSVMAGNQLADFGKSLPIVIKPICLFCASMGYHLFQSFNERLVQPSSVLMSHRVSLSGVEGQLPGELLSRIQFYAKISQEMDKAVAKRVGLTPEAYMALIYDELWLTGQQAIDTKHADKMTKIYCSNELLKGERKEIVPTFFGPVEVTFSKCPLIQGMLGFKFQRVVNEPRNTAELMMTIKKVRRTAIKEWF